jgi:hypothetical protein
MAEEEQEQYLIRRVADRFLLFREKLADEK